METLERKNEERFREIESLIKRVGIKVDQRAASIADETQNEFHNIKTQFEDFGNSIYEKISIEVQDKIAFELTKSLTILQDSINSDFTTIINENLKPIDLKILTFENHCEDLRIAQEQALEELTKYQDNLENIIG